MNYSKKETSKKQKALQSKNKKMGKKMSVIFFKAFFVCIIAVGVIGICAGFGIVKGVIDNAPDITSESVMPTGYKSVVYDAEGNKMQELIASGTNRTMVTIDQIPDHVQKAFVAIEDERFYEHNGIDLIGIVRAALKGVAKGFHFTEGASTITQQLLKNNVFNFMEEKDFADKLERKIQEQYLALKLEKTMGKDEILQAYLNTINLGQNTLGVQAASNRYFDKDVWELTISEAAVIAGITKSPESFNPVKNEQKNADRRLIVLNNMKDQGYINQSEYEEALADDVYSRIKTVNESVVESSTVNSYFTDAVVKEVLEDLKELKGYSDTQAYNVLYGGGLRIHTTMNPEIQKIMDEEFADPANYPASSKVGLEYALTVIKPDGTTTNYSQEMMQKYYKEKNGASKYDLLYADAEGAQAAIDEYEASLGIGADDTVYRSVKLTVQPQTSMVVIDQSTGYVQGIIGGRGEKTASLTLNRATDTLRPAGSTFKIVSTYAPALDAGGLTLATTQYDGPYQYEEGAERRLVNNYSRNYLGWMSLRTAIIKSQNIPAVKTYQEIGIPLGLSYLDKFGFTTIQKETNSQGSSDTGPSVALGGLTNGVSNLELTAAYAAIANAGTYKEPLFYTRIEDSEGNIIIDRTATQETHEVVSEETAWLLTSAMEDVVKSGTGTSLKFPGMSIAGKTGTTSDNKDRWFAGFTPYYTATTWGGYDKNQELPKAERSYHNVLWKAVMSRIHENLENKSFEKPDGIVQKSVCSYSGKLAIPGICEADPRGNGIKTEYFAGDNVPTESCDVHVIAPICDETGLLATDRCPFTHNEMRVIIPILQEGVGGAATPDTPYGVDMNNPGGSTCSVHSGGEYVQSLVLSQNYERIMSLTSARKNKRTE
ncbi:MAG: transglycosylase domain-containing protein [Lachnospiraceae bacterium]